jgi:uncharacterized hydrophobic protein (TIGR00271 family)
VHLEAVSTTPAGEVVICDVVRESANDVIEFLQAQGVHHGGAITVEALEAVVSDAAEAAEAMAPGHSADSLIWEELEARARSDAALTVSFALFMCIAAVIAGIGILLDSPILIVGAMVVGPEYGPLAAMCVALARRRWSPAAHAARTLGIGFAVAAAGSFVATVVFRASNLARDQYDLSDRELTAFISHPDGLAAVIAVLAGIAGMLALTEGRPGTLIGVLVSVATIPAVANVGVATAYGAWDEVWGAAIQLVVNVAGLVIAGVITLVVQNRATARRERRVAPA